MRICAAYIHAHGLHWRLAMSAMSAQQVSVRCLCTSLEASGPHAPAFAPGVEKHHYTKVPETACAMQSSRDILPIARKADACLAVQMRLDAAQQSAVLRTASSASMCRLLRGLAWLLRSTSCAGTCLASQKGVLQRW